MRVLLQRKLAEIIDGVDLTSRSVGDVFETPAGDARLLVAEGWAIIDRRLTTRAHDTSARAPKLRTRAPASST